MSEASCARFPEDASYKTIGLDACPDCSTYDCWLHYLRWEVRHGITLNEQHHHLVSIDTEPPSASMMAELQLITDALKMVCRRCKGGHLDVCSEEPIKNVPGLGTVPVISYACRDCGLDSASDPDASCCPRFEHGDRTHELTCRFYKTEPP